MESPCINVCVIEPASGECSGCRRTLQEIAAWASLDDEGRRRVIRELPARHQRQARLKRCGR